MAICMAVLERAALTLTLSHREREKNDEHKRQLSSNILRIKKAFFAYIVGVSSY